MGARQEFHTVRETRPENQGLTGEEEKPQKSVQVSFQRDWFPRFPRLCEQHYLFIAW